MKMIDASVEVVQAAPATKDQIGAVHTASHMERVRAQGVYNRGAS